MISVVAGEGNHRLIILWVIMVMCRTIGDGDRNDSSRHGRL